MHSFEVHSNESACRKKVRLGLEKVLQTDAGATPEFEGGSRESHICT